MYVPICALTAHAGQKHRFLQAVRLRTGIGKPLSQAWQNEASRRLSSVEGLVMEMVLVDPLELIIVHPSH